MSAIAPALRPKCVVCRGNLTEWANPDAAPGIEMRLAPVGDQTEYCLRVLGHRGQPRPTAGFTDVHGVIVFHLCGGGHIFFVRNELAGTHHVTRVAQSNVEMVAVLGSVAAGKSYLTVRVLNQPLNGPYGSDTVSVTPKVRNLIEARPLGLLETEYDRMRGSGKPMEGTQLESMFPKHFLAGLHDDLIVDLSRLLGEVMRETPSSDGDWLSNVRQPVVRRYELGKGRDAKAEVVLAVADLSGELFDTASHNTSLSASTRHALTLQRLAEFSTLIWAVDPAVSSAFRAWASTAPATAWASMRPEDRPRELSLVVADREGPQSYVAEVLADATALNIRGASTQRLVVAIAKSDLIKDALVDGLHLSKLGPPDAVLGGVVSHLHYLVDKAGSDDSMWSFAEQETSRLLHLLAPRNKSVRATALRQFGDALIDHFSDPYAFWSLVHTGTETVIQVPDHEPAVDHPGYAVRVSTVERYLVDSLPTTGSGALGVRDIVMSALACGIACGLGFKGEIAAMLNQDRRPMMFTLCSPFGGVPTLKPAQTDAIELSGSAPFPSSKDPSAGLTHIHLHLLRRWLP